MPHVIIAKFESDQECANFLLRALGGESEFATLDEIARATGPCCPSQMPFPTSPANRRSLIEEMRVGAGLPQNGLNVPTPMSPGIHASGVPAPVRVPNETVASEIAAADGSPMIFQNDEDMLAEEVVRNGQGDVTAPPASPAPTGPELNHPRDPQQF